MAKKLFTAQKRGETRAVCLGIGMIVCSVMMFFLLGVTVLPSYLKSVWTEETICTLNNTSFKEKVCCSYSSNGECEKTSFYYPCLEVLVNLNYSEDIFMLHHTEITTEVNPECTYIPRCDKNYTELKIHVEEIQERFKRKGTFNCSYDPRGRQKNIILVRKYGPRFLISYFFWPGSMFTGGLIILIMVKITQYLSMVSVRSS
ncbi:calcium-activated potassium channel subunit beta-1 [Bombina bombina]|uniref:calcium-activated potassium channel subunit beta-1 n=1 Tax=Bombina bombina TaxID=8345 RepID=UPI00235AEF22|nr:calcium-activated potassium channel subunit beta-1 [Bombina bombina]XP_053572145.1 calcium-activated potassium channel subunit beta-1 [Bombina bombina]